MFRAGLSGTNWTGKTETIRRFVRAQCELNIEIVSLSDLVDKCPFPMMENQTLEASQWMAEKVADLCKRNTGEMQIFDRTPVDILAYTLYAEKRTGSQHISTFENILDLIKYFDILFYIPLSNKWPVNASASWRKIEFAREMDSYIRKAIDKFALDVVSLPWDLSERQGLMCEYLKSSPITLTGEQ